MSNLEFLQGHVLDRLRELPDESVHCVCTSPPYFSLRDYGIEPTVWDGDVEGCQHEWPSPTIRTVGRNDGGRNIGGLGGNYQGEGPHKAVVPIGGFCQHCSAWRGALGLEPDPEMFIDHIVQVFREVRRVLRRDGTLWLNMGDSYVAGPTGHQDISNANGKAAQMFAKGGRYRVDNLRKDAHGARRGLPAKSLMMMPARVAIAMQADGWILRSDIIWCKRAPMPESVTDRPTSAHEHIFMFARSGRYFYDADAVREPSAPASLERVKSGWNGNEYRGHPDPAAHNNISKYMGTDRAIALAEQGRNLWNYWLLSPESFAEAHFATYPTEIPRRAIRAGTSQHGCCGVCGAGWRRVVERDGTAYQDAGNRKRADAPGAITSLTSVFRTGHITATQTTGWTPTCPCGHDAPIVPATVLDPFSGAGTTGLVAVELGRDYLGIELKQEYIDMAKRRIMGKMPLFAYQSLEEGRAL